MTLTIADLDAPHPFLQRRRPQRDLCVICKGALCVPGMLSCPTCSKTVRVVAKPARRPRPRFGRRSRNDMIDFGMFPLRIADDNE